MDAETKNKLKPILLRSNLNQFVSEDELAFARQCWREWPKEYSAIQSEEVHPKAAKQYQHSARRPFQPNSAANFPARSNTPNAWTARTTRLIAAEGKRSQATVFALI